MKIKAFAIMEKGGRAEPFLYERVIEDMAVAVRITHCSVARGDVQYITDDWGDTRFPLVPGHEIVGVVTARGRSVEGLSVGDRVGVGYQQSACFVCDYCREGHEQFCAQQKAIAIDCFGGWAEHIVVDHRFAFKLPATLASLNAAPLMSAGLTVFAGIRKAALPPGATVGVLGIGGLGQLAIQFLCMMGHQVFAFSRSPEKQSLISDMGGSYINSCDFQALAGHARRFDFILSTVNAVFDADSYLRLLKAEGKFCMVASPLQKLGISAGLLYDFASRSIFGNYIGSRRDTVEMLDFAAAHNIRAAVDVMPFADINRAIQRVREEDTTRKVVLEWPASPDVKDEI